MPSFLESNAHPTVSIPGILGGLPGCKHLFKDAYRDTVEAVAPSLSIMHPAKFAQIASAFADGRLRRELFASYMLTEHCGGVFIESLLAMHASHPAATLLSRHASDEKRHGEMFARLAGTAIAGHLDSEAFALESRYHDAYARWVGDDLFSLICLLHGFELRSGVLQCHWFALMDMFPDSEAAAIRPTFTQISTDEVFHITYTAKLVAAGLAEGGSSEKLATALRLAEMDIAALEEMV